MMMFENQWKLKLYRYRQLYKLKCDLSVRVVRNRENRRYLLMKNLSALQLQNSMMRFALRVVE